MTMRKAKEMRDKKEIFKKERLPVDELDVDSLDEMNVVNQTQVVTKHHKRHSKHKRPSRHHSHSHSQSTHPDPKVKENLKFKRRKEKLRVSCDQTFPAQPETVTDRKSLITKNRLTRCIGIYNKGKTSDTIYREQRKSKFFNKVSDSLKEKTNEDMSKVLDCSSFQIRPLHVTTDEIFLDDQDSHSVTSSSHSEHQITFSATSASPPRREVRSVSPASFASTVSLNNAEISKCSPLKTLPFKTPLTEITQKLLNSLEPLETFGRDYLQEIRDELKSYYRKSSSMLDSDDAEPDVLLTTSTPNNVAITPVRIGSKTNPSRKLFMSSIGKIEYMSRKNAHARLYGDHSNHGTPMETDVENEEIDDVRRLPVIQNDSHDIFHMTSQFLPQNKPTLSQPFATKEELVSMGCIPRDQPTLADRPPYDHMPRNPPTLTDHSPYYLPRNHPTPYDYIPGNQPTLTEHPPYDHVPRDQPPTLTDHPPYDHMPRDQPTLTDHPPYCMQRNQPTPYDHIPRNQPALTDHPLYDHMARDQPTLTDHALIPPYDILSILDNHLRCNDEVGLVESPIYSEISPLKKPSLEITTPPEKLLPRKLF